jgi:ABC-type Mn2+/Zn2+ transport system permease subunit
MLSLAVVLGVRLLGIILVTALLITPAMTSKLCTSSFKQYLVGSVIFSLLSVAGGLIFSYHLDLPTGATIVLFSTVCFIITFVVTKMRFLR